MKYLSTILIVLLFLRLLSLAPAPPALLPAIVARPVLSTRVILQECSEQIARQTGVPYLREVVSDARGYPVGEVAAWSCAGDVGATIAEFNSRKAAMLR